MALQNLFDSFNLPLILLYSLLTDLQMVPHPQDRPHLRGGGVNEEAGEFEDSERGDVAYPRRTIRFEVMSCANSYPERMRSSSQGYVF